MKNTIYKTNASKKVFNKIVVASLYASVLAMFLFYFSASSSSASENVSKNSTKNQCVDTLIIGARGSGGMQEGSVKDNYTGVSEQVYSLYTKIDRKLNKNNKTTKLVAVEYPALPVESLLVSASEFEKSIKQGADDIVNKSIEIKQVCPKTEIIVIGYSQGAMAVHTAEDLLPTNVKAIVLLSDGFRLENDKARVLGGAPRKTNGLAVGRLKNPLQLDGFPKAVHVCVTEDIVCSSNASSINPEIHTKGYLDRKLQNNIVKHVVKLL